SIQSCSAMTRCTCHCLRAWNERPPSLRPTTKALPEPLACFSDKDEELPLRNSYHSNILAHRFLRKSISLLLSRDKKGSGQFLLIASGFQKPTSFQLGRLYCARGNELGTQNQATRSIHQGEA